MSSGDGGGGLQRCNECGAEAAGPCASCRRPVCGDCCVLTSGPDPWAVCVSCAERGRSSLRGPWLTVLGWIGKPILVLIALYIVLRLML
jgi:hypothetical protein